MLNSGSWYLDETASHVTSKSVAQWDGEVVTRDWAPDGTLILEDTFTGGAGNLTGHTPETGSWTIGAGAFALNGSGQLTASSAGHIYMSTGTTSGTVEAVGQTSAQGNAVSALQRLITTSDWVNSTRFINSGTPSSSQGRLFSDASQITGVNLTGSLNTDYTLKTKISGGTVGIWINGVLRIDVVNDATLEANNPSTTNFGLFLSTSCTMNSVKIWDQ
jgi:hypothetical protein